MDRLHEHPKSAGLLYHKPMGHWKDHEHRPKEKKYLVITLVLTSSTMILEVIGGILTGSLALLSDAGHMLSHSLALFISYLAIVFASRPSAKKHSFGYYRIEVLAALFNGLTMFGIVAFIVYEAFQRIFQPQPIHSFEMFLVASLGLAVNVICAVILARAGKHDLNVRSAFLHMLGDTASSLGVIICAVIIHYTNWILADVLASILISIVIGVWGVQLLRDSLNILLEATPQHIRVEEVISTICNKLPEVYRLHDVHIWEITSHMYAMSAHALIDDRRISETHVLLEKIATLLHERYNINHANIQFEHHPEVL